MTRALLQLSNGYCVRCWEQLATVFVGLQIKGKCHRQIVIGSLFPPPVGDPSMQSRAITTGLEALL